MTDNDLQRLGLALLNSPAEAIAYSDREGIIRFWNAGAERVFGFTAEEALGQSLDIIIPDRQRQRHWDGYDQVMKTGESRYGSGDLLSVPATRKDGTRISVEFTIVPLKDADGAMMGMAAVMRDVTARFDEVKALRRQAAGR
ncbi:PAS sensor domain-containing protein [Azospirillum brasilense]|uniref:PAS domain S-box protein n=1 Tax=Azospirillum brasilense TaxID=192 RepID=A0A0P0EIU4_AZOBR|nr:MULTISPECIES: PAS domain S-box protein [Azospirillum]ALJ39001.1 PAS sensor protein [Azospirillum brasilense]MDW7557292.1 PAS domain S-box protein [Azospirillum brasilense]MDW7596294.1 PAS domain S-box protein [Azospirillum brasilense]MDW7631751.1 PAS domain S-box protein [Azospirillum brasilense]MDX5950591.1 PAS domain S-box protein [Azospirillum brasilense]